MRRCGRKLCPGGWAGLLGFLLALLCGAALLCGVPAGRSEAAAGARSTRSVPPRVQVLSPAPDAQVMSSPIRVELAVQLPPGDTATRLRARIDDQEVQAARGITLTPQAAGATHVLSVPVPARDCTLTIVAETERAQSPPVQLRLRWRGRAPVDPAELAALQPALYVLAIGISEYQRPELALRFAATDARELAAVLHRQERLYRKIEVRTLTDADATKDRILDGMEWLQRQTTARDVAVLFFAGHGITDPASGRYYFLPHEASADAIRRTMLPDTEVQTTVRSIAGKVVLFLDTCHSGRLFGSAQRGASDVSAFIRELIDTEPGLVVFAAATGRQASQESAAWGHGAFTRALVEGLRGQADAQRTGRVTVGMLELYISERVKELTRGAQTPTSARPTSLPDFPLALSAWTTTSASAPTAAPAALAGTEPPRSRPGLPPATAETGPTIVPPTEPAPRVHRPIRPIWPIRPIRPRRATTSCEAYLVAVGVEHAAFYEQFGPTGSCWNNGPALYQKCLELCVHLQARLQAGGERLRTEQHAAESVLQLVQALRRQEDEAAQAARTLLFPVSPARSDAPLEPADPPESLSSQCRRYLREVHDRSPAFLAAFGSRSPCWQDSDETARQCDARCGQLLRAQARRVSELAPP